MSEKKKVLVIDDDKVHLYTASELLSSRDVEVITHQGSFGATSTLKNVNPDLVLLDMNMPALSGENLAAIIKPFCTEHSIPIIFYSSNDELTLKESAEKNGVHGYISKGDIQSLRSTVREYLRSNA